MTPAIVTGRFEDAHVLADPSLRTLAERYARGYIGGFHELLNARSILVGGGTLNTSQIRMVLNCMLTSTGVINMPQPPVREVFDAGQQDVEVSNALPFFRRPKRQRQIQPTRYPFDLNARARLPFIYSTNPRAYNIHLIRDVRVTHWPAAIQNPWHERFTCTIRCFCAENWMGGRPYLRVAGLEEAYGLVESGRRWCKTCKAAWE